MPTAATPDVLIIGAGPVGVYLGGLLRSYGCEVLVVDRESCLYPHSRAVAMDDGVVRLLGMIHPTLSVWMSQNCLPAPLDIRSKAPPSAAQAGWPGTYSILGPFPPRPMASSGGYPEISYFHQPSLEGELRRWAFGRDVDLPTPPATLVEGVEAGGLTPLPCPPCTAAVAAGVHPSPLCPACRVGVTLTPVHHPGKGGEEEGGVRRRPAAAAGAEAEAPRSVHARWVIGCDGGSSGTRKAIGGAFLGDSFPAQPWLVVDCESLDPELCARWKCFNFVCDPHRTYVHCPLPNAGRRFEFLLKPGEGEGPMDVTSAPFVHSLLLSIGVPPTSLTILRKVVYTFHARMSTKWISSSSTSSSSSQGFLGRVLLAGDAAHCMPPFRGQGMCSGMRDAAYLAWRLGGIVKLSGSFVKSIGSGNGGKGSSRGERSRSRARSVSTAGATGGSGGGGGGGAPLSPPSPPPSPHSASHLLQCYEDERKWHVRQVTRLTVALGKLIMIHFPPLAYLRNMAVACLNAIPPLKPFLRDGMVYGHFFGLALPTRQTGVGGGWFDFGGGVAGGGGGEERERVGEPFPNVPVWSPGEEEHGGGVKLLDTALYHLKRGMGGEEGGAATPWVLLLSPSTPTTTLAEALLDITTQQHRGVLVVQFLPPTAASQRSTQHREWRLGSVGLGGGGGGGGGGRRLKNVDGRGEEHWWAYTHCALGDWKGEAEEWFEGKASSASAALIRPDGLVFGVYQEGEEERLKRGLRCAALMQSPPTLTPQGWGWVWVWVVGLVLFFVALLVLLLVSPQSLSYHLIFKGPLWKAVKEL